MKTELYNKHAHLPARKSFIGYDFPRAVCVTFRLLQPISFKNSKCNETFYRIKALISYHTFFIILIILTSTHPAKATTTGPGSSWQYARKITLSGATPLADFQVRITLAAGQYGNMNANGDDLRFYDNNNNACNYWIELWNTGGTSVIWVKVPSSGSSSIFMYYGNGAATAASNGSGVFDFFDDFAGTSLSANWTSNTANGSVAVAGGTVTITCSTNNGSITSPGIASSYTPGSTSYIVETKHRETAYNRNRFYAANTAFPTNPLGFDNGYFNTGTTAATTANVFWNGFQAATVSRNTDYLTQWQITDNSTYTWKTFTYGATLAQVSTNTTTYSSLARILTIAVTEVNGTSTSIDWARVRKSSSSFTDVTGTAGPQVTNISATINTQTNVLCNGNSTGSATATASGGATPYSYSWNTSPVQTTQTASGLGSGTYTVTITDNTGISATAMVTITEPAALGTSNSASNVNCFGAGDGQIIVTGTGGLSPYLYSVDNGSSYQSSDTFNGLAAGKYKIRIKDSNGCESKPVQ